MEAKLPSGKIKLNMKKANLKNKNGWSWAFAIVNGRLAEIYFNSDGGVRDIYGHCCVKRSEYKTKSEHNMIDKDIKKFHLSYRNNKYKEKM